MSIKSSPKKTLLTYIVLSFSCLIFMISSENKVILFFKDIQNTIFYPFRLVVRGLQQELISIKNTFFSKADSSSELEKLKIELENYKQQLINLNSSEEENIRLRNILELKQHTEYTGIIAEVIAYDFIYVYSYLTLNKGRMDGIVDGLPVITFINGNKVVVGIVSEATLLTSKVRTVKSELSSLGVYLPRVNIHSVVMGLGGTSKNIQLLYIDKDIPIIKGDPVYTSIESSLFPPNILIGQVSSIDNTKKTSTSYQVYLKPAVLFEELSEVFVLKPKNDK